MTARTMGRVRRAASEHTDWCARDHRCNLGEHRSAEIIADLPGHGRAVITRVRSGHIEYAEVRARIPLHSNESAARWQVATALRLMRDLLAAVVVRPGVLRRRPDRPVIDRAPRSA